VTNTVEQREIFWKLFDKILSEKHENFRVAYVHRLKNEITSYGAVNRYQSFNANALDLSFVLRDGMFRVNLYISKPSLIRKVNLSKDDINSMVTLPIVWDNGKGCLRPSVYFSFIPNDIDDYRRVIEESLTTIHEFIDVANKYGKNDFFDYE